MAAAVIFDYPIEFPADDCERLVPDAGHRTAAGQRTPSGIAGAARAAPRAFCADHRQYQAADAGRRRRCDPHRVLPPRLPARQLGQGFPSLPQRKPHLRNPRIAPGTSARRHRHRGARTCSTGSCSRCSAPRTTCASAKCRSSKRASAATSARASRRRSASWMFRVFRAPTTPTCISASN